MSAQQFEVQVVNSTVIHSIGYAEESGTMRVIFRRGAGYDYAGVERDTFEALAMAESVGQLFNQRIRTVYACESLNGRTSSTFLMSILDAAADQRLIVAG